MEKVKKKPVNFINLSVGMWMNENVCIFNSIILYFIVMERSCWFGFYHFGNCLLFSFNRRMNKPHKNSQHIKCSKHTHRSDLINVLHKLITLKWLDYLITLSRLITSCGKCERKLSHLYSHAIHAWNEIK